jgi:hypothetical protein
MSIYVIKTQIKRVTITQVTKVTIWFLLINIEVLEETCSVQTLFL